jgi:hypothetical protein
MVKIQFPFQRKHTAFPLQRPINALQENNCYLFQDSYETHTYILCTLQSSFTIRGGGVYSNHHALNC